MSHPLTMKKLFWTGNVNLLEVHSILFDKRDALLIREMALKFSVALVDYVLGFRTNRFIYVAL